jgi:hypothetical protein
MNYLHGQTSNRDPPDLCILSSWDYRHEPPVSNYALFLRQGVANFALAGLKLKVLPSTFCVAWIAGARVTCSSRIAKSMHLTSQSCPCVTAEVKEVKPSPQLLVSASCSCATSVGWSPSPPGATMRALVPEGTRGSSE